MNLKETSFKAPKGCRVLKTDRFGIEDKEWCYNESCSSFDMSLIEATQIQLKLSGMYGDTYSYEVVLYEGDQK